MKSAITVSLVEEARGGPFVYHDGLAEACERAAALGFDGVEIFPPSAEAVDAAALSTLLTDHGLSLAAVGTGAGWVKHKLTLTMADAAERKRARDFVRQVIDLGGQFGAPAIIGSMQGRAGGDVDHETGLRRLGDALHTLGEHARQYDVPLLYEHLNRYETDLCNTVETAVTLLDSLGASNVALLCDLFHMNIEEEDIAAALRAAGRWLGHVHFVDSNRRAVGYGHIDYGPIGQTLLAMGYEGYLSAEALPLPDSDSAARQTMRMFRQIAPSH